MTLLLLSACVGDKPPPPETTPPDDTATVPTDTTDTTDNAYPSADESAEAARPNVPVLIGAPPELRRASAPPTRPTAGASRRSGAALPAVPPRPKE